MDKLSYKLNALEGPLDLLLHLIAKNKLNIYDINICELVKQYLDCINQMKEQSMDVSSDFLEMASRLVYIKSVSLLPKDEESEELKDKLSGELIEYRTVKLLSGELSKIADGFGKFIRQPTMPSVDQTYLLTHDRRVLSHWYLAAVGRGQRRLPPPATAFEPLVKKPVIPVSAKIVYVIRRLFSGVKVKYKSMFSSVKSKSEAVATFLAILELIRGGRIAIDQNDDLKMVGKEK